MKESQFIQKVKKYLNLVVSQDGSDLHLSAGNYPAIRIDSKLKQLKEEDVIAKSDMEILAQDFLNEERLKKLDNNRQVDFSIEIGDNVRFRVNMFYQKGALSFCARLIPCEVKSLKELGVSENVYEFADCHQGLFLVVGPNGHGKTTTIASLIDYVNQRKERHIITIEDPIEYIFNSQQSLVEQREIYEDAVDFPTALKASFREDVDIVFVGEMRDLETISTAITAAETGHLIFGTLHTNNATQTIDRIIDVFPAYQQNQIRYQLSTVLTGVVSQRLLPKVGGGRIPAIEIMKCNNAIANLIRQNQTHQIGVVMETSLDDGMISINRSLANLVSEGQVSLEDAEGFATDSNAFKMFLEST